MGSINASPNTIVYIRENDIGNIQYSTNLSSWIGIGEPCTITNTDISLNQYLTIKLYTNLTFRNSNQYFIMGSEYIIFDGDNKKITIDNVLNYPGLIQNGTFSNNGYSNVTIKNLGIETSGTSTLSSSSSGWVTQFYFSKGAINNIIDNCYSTGEISDYRSGGISGASTGVGGHCTISNCYSTGIISGNEASGICSSGAGQNSGNCIITNCYSTGNITGSQASGIIGSFAAQNGNCNVSYCYSTGEISGNSSGGICSTGAGFLNGNCNISNCYSTGEISGSSSGGICGYYTGNNNGICTITNCFSIGEISGLYTGGICGEYTGGENGSCIITNSYSLGNISGNSTGGISGRYTAALDSSSCIITNCYSLGNIIGTNSGGICGEYAGGDPFYGPPVYGSCIVSNCYSFGSFSSSNGIFGANKQVTATETNTYSANGSWSTTNALLNLTGFPTYSSSTQVIQGTTWTDYNISTVNTPWVLSSFNDELYNPNSKNIKKIKIYNTTSSEQNGTNNLIISVNNSSSYSNISINPISGVITYTKKPIGLYETLVINYNLSGSFVYGYQINNFDLTVSKSNKLKRPRNQQQALNQSLTIRPIWKAYKYYRYWANKLGFNRIDFNDYKNNYYK